MSKLLRVTQLDAIFLDKEIEKLLKALIENATKFLPPGLLVPYEPEIHFALRLVTLYFSLFKSNATFGQQLLLIKYDKITIAQKCFYLFLSSFPYIKERFEFSNTFTINKPVSIIDGACKILSLINLSIFLRYGAKPSLLDRVLGLNLVNITNAQPRQFNNRFMTRELLWSGFIELLVFILPFVNFRKLRRLARNLNPLNKSMNAQRRENRIFTLDTKCGECNDSPVLPHHMGCTHVFCYVCLKSNQDADAEYECPKCGHSEYICEMVNMK